MKFPQLQGHFAGNHICFMVISYFKLLISLLFIRKWKLCRIKHTQTTKPQETMVHCLPAYTIVQGHLTYILLW